MPQVGAFLMGAVGFGAPALGAASFGAWAAGAGFAASALGGVVVNLVTSVAASALARALTPDAKPVGVRTNSTMTGGANSDAFVLGWYATEGQIVAPPMSHGQNGKTPNAWMTYVIELGGPGQTLDSVIIDGEPVTLDAAPEPGGAGFAVLGRIAGHAWVKYYDGTQTAADPWLIERYGSYERPWTAQHIGTGIAYAIVTFTYNREIFSGFPKVRFVVNGLPLYDPRQDSTAGGSGAQRWNNRATWAVTRNPMVMIYNILRGITLPGGHVWGGECEAEDLPYARWAAAMDDCDELHDGEARYRAGFEVLAEDEPYSVIQELLTTCGGQLAEMGGEWVPAVGAPDLPVMFITDDDLIVTEADDFAPFPSPESTYNGVTATFPRPSSVWEASEIQPIYFPALEAEDGGRRLMASLQVNACPYPKQVRRVAREAVRDSRRWRRHSLALPPEAGVLQPLDTISWTSARNGYAAKLFEVAEVARDPRGAAVALVLRERDAADYDFAAETLPTPPSVVPVRPASQAVPGWSVTGASISDGGGVARRPALQFGWTAEAAEDATGLRWEVRRAGTTAVVVRGSTHDVEAGGLAVVEGLLPATGYEARARLVVSRRRTAWSSWISAATPDVRLGAADVSDDFTDEIERIAEVAGIRTVATLPATGEKPNQVVMLVPPGRLYRWDSTAGVWTTQLYSGIEPGSLQIASFAAGIEPVGVVTSPTLPAVKTTTTIVWQGKLYRWNGTAYVASVPAADVTGQLTSAQIASLDAAKLAGQITSSQIGTGAVLASALADAAVSVDKLASGAVTGAKIADAALTVGKFASGVRPVEIVSALPTTGNFDGRQAYLTSDKRLYRHNGTVWVNANAADQIVGQLAAGQIAAGAINAEQIAANAITSAKIAAGAVTANEIAANAITATKLAANSVTAASISAESITSAKIAADAVTASQIAADAVTAVKIAAAAITVGAIAADAVTASKIAANAVTATAISAGAVTTAKIAAGAITANEISANAITSAKIAAGAIGASQIAAGAILASKLSVSDFTNQVPDSEVQDAASWVRNAKISINTTSPRADSRSLGSLYYDHSLNTDASDASAFSAGFFPVTPGDELFVSGQVIRVGGTRIQVRVHILFYDRNDTILATDGSLVAISLWGITTNTSVPYTGTVTVPAGAFQARYRYYVYGGAGETDGNLHLGAPVVRIKSRGELIVDGAITAAKIAAGAITADSIAAGAVLASSIATGAISASKIAAGAVTAEKMSVASLSAISATIGVLRTATTGERLEIRDNRILVYDENNVIRVRIGEL